MKVKICTWKSCKEKFSEYIFDRLQNDKEKFDLKNLEIEKTFCMWNCEKSVNIEVWKEKFSLQNPIKTSALILKKLENENI